MINRYTAAFLVLVLSLACSGSGHSELAQQECTPAADASACEKCFIEKCAEQCMDCVDDPTCYSCGEAEGLDPACSSNEQFSQFLTCVLTADCQAACSGEAPPTRPPRVGKGRKRPAGGGGGGEGKAGKGGKHKGGN